MTKRLISRLVDFVFLCERNKERDGERQREREEGRERVREIGKGEARGG